MAFQIHDLLSIVIINPRVLFQIPIPCRHFRRMQTSRKIPTEKLTTVISNNIFVEIPTSKNIQAKVFSGIVTNIKMKNIHSISSEINNSKMFVVMLKTISNIMKETPKNINGKVQIMVIHIK